MKRIKTAVFLAACILAISGCGSKTERWAYNHETDKEILSLDGRGRAVYKGEKYGYTQDDSFINLTDSEGKVTSLRYFKEGDQLTLYESSTYKYDGDGTPKGIVGAWSQSNNWTFQFNEDGKFCEDNIFYGYYSVDEEASTIKLMYDEPLQDAILYYSLNGSELTIDYPWTLVPLTKKDTAVVETGTEKK